MGQITKAGPFTGRANSKLIACKTARHAFGIVILVDIVVLDDRGMIGGLL